MFHKVKNVAPLNNYLLSVSFVEGITKLYDVKPLFKKWDVFNKLKNNNLFYDVQVDQGGFGISWNDEIDLPSDTIYEYGRDCS